MIVSLPAAIDPPERLGAIHFVGIGGAALSGLARLMRARGNPVSGCDAHDSAMLEALRSEGIACSVGHDAAHLAGVDTVVVSTAVSEDNPEVRAALQRDLRVWSRAAAVQSLLQDRRSVVVTGTHGKTTTTSMLVTALLACDVDLSYAVGSTLNASGRNAAAGTDAIFVAEGDESDAAILAYTPFGAVITNVDVDHLDFFGTPEAYAQVFADFLERVDPAGFAVFCVDDPGARRLAEARAREGLRTVTVGFDEAAQLRAVEVEADAGSTRCTVLHHGRELGRMTLAVPGPAYVQDALAALGAGLELGYPSQCLLTGLAEYRGSGRRMEHKGTAAGVDVYDSYAHHPVEIESDLRAARQLAGAGRVVVAFQPHLFSRTRIFGARMGHALGAADEVVVLDVYPAREAPEPGVTGALVADAVPLEPDRVAYEPVFEEVPRRLIDRARAGDLVLTLGAGDVTAIGPRVLALLGAREASQPTSMGETINEEQR